MTILDSPAAFTTLPRELYLDDLALFEAEMERVWYRQWLYLAHASEIPEPGDFVVRCLLGESILVVRTADGGVVAHLNVCRHRGARMVDEPCGRLRRIVCPYHQWTYELDGRLKAAPSMAESEGLDHDALALYAVPVEIWNGLILGCLGAEPPAPFGPELERLAAPLTGYGFERTRPVVRRSYTCGANWKVVLENYLECYHCAGAHPEFCVTADLRARATDEFNAQAFDPAPYWGMDVELRQGARTASLTGEDVCRVPLREEAFGRARSFGSWCAASVLYAYGDHAMVHTIAPVSACETAFHLTWLVHEDATDGDVDLDVLTHVWDATTRQDVALIERAQDGVRSRRYTPGPISVRHEPYIRSSLQMYVAAMGGEEAVRRFARR
jgi:glycine betaine monooxygenase A